MGNLRVSRLVAVALFVVALVGGSDRAAVGGGPDVEQRIADFWNRINAMQPDDYLSSADIGQWALNVIDRDSSTRITVADFRAATGVMQSAMDRAGRGSSVATPRPIATPVPTPIAGLLGLSRSNPAGSGVGLPITVSSFVSGTFDLSITQQAVIRGVAANQMVKAANMFNGDPKPGMEYLVVSLRLTYLKGPTVNTAYDASRYDFKIVSTQGAEYDNPFCVSPAPDFGTKLYAGASSEGWACFMVNQNDPQPTMVFGRNYDGSGGRWWRLGW